MQPELKVINAKDFAKETLKDKTISKIIKFVKDDCPEQENLSENELKYDPKKEELYVEKDCLLWGYRVILPESLRVQVFEELHVSHFGSVKMRMRARSYVWWPKIDAQLEELAATSKICIQDRKNPPKAPLNPWPTS